MCLHSGLNGIYPLPDKIPGFALSYIEIGSVKLKTLGHWLRICAIIQQHQVFPRLVQPVTLQ